MQVDEYTNINEFFSQIIDSVNYSIYWKDIDGIYLGCNLFAAQKAGLQSSREIIGKTDYDLFNYNIANKFRENDLKVITHGIEISVEEPTKLADGTQIIQLSSKKPLYNKNHQIIGIIGNTVDITAQKEKERLELENKAYLTKIQTEERFKRFINAVQHEIESYRIDVLNENTGTIVNYNEFDKQIKITKRQTEILYYLSLNKSPKEIAFILSKLQNKAVTPATISAIINKHLYPKFGVFNISELIEKATALSLIPFILNP